MKLGEISIFQSSDYLIFPGVAEGIHVVLGDARARTSSENTSCVDHLRAQCFDLRSGVADHLDTVFIARHGTGQIGHLHQFIGVFQKHLNMKTQQLN